ncbi:Hypothetical protein IALB_1791 [Ignavibacterium album JCM 16511]|uniref:FMN-binding domain-containing protein n=1 Tax=Ignavibacterium album (strain DSM 19864 / JCM 16511 / NBRC 101810 / Mat9-16) TaxID=945713 RepID=I0AKJ1_IGNAJ|nr:FMN-binding protein [Ignavibacterium album]AFH49498.1 Hypothetical protein IALB_1791 [Ignavibacterium album JCM 16511]
MKTLTILFLFLNVLTFSQDIKENIAQALHNCFGNNIRTEYEKLRIENKLRNEIEKKAGQKFFSEEIYFYKIFDENKIKGYALLDNVYGKSLPITFMVMFDLNGKILCSDIIKYREPYGGAVQSKEWNSQFKGKDAQSEFFVGKDVSSISGATISVNSVTKGIKKLTLLIKSLLKK